MTLARRSVLFALGVRFALYLSPALAKGKALVQFGLLEVGFPFGWKFSSQEAGPIEGSGPSGEFALVSHSAASSTASVAELRAHFQSMREQGLLLLGAVATEKGTVAREPVVLRESSPLVMAAASALDRHGQKSYFLQYMLLSLRSQHYFNIAGLGPPAAAMARWDPIVLSAKVLTK